MASGKQQGVLHKLEKGLVGRKWTKKFVTADHKALMYFASVAPGPEEAPRKVFNLDDCSVGITSRALNAKFKITKQFTFMVEDRASDYTAIFSTETAEERDAWLKFLENPAPDKRRSHLSTAIEDKLVALNLPPDSKEYAMAVYECLVEPNDKTRMQSQYLRVLLGHMGKGTFDNVVDALKNELDSTNSGSIMLADFTAWLDADGPSRVPDIAPTRQSVMDFDSHLETKEEFMDVGRHLEGITEGDESMEVPQQTLDMQAQLAAQVAQRAKRLEVNPEWDDDNPPEGDSAAATPAPVNGSGDKADVEGDAPTKQKPGDHTPRTEDSNRPGEGVDVQFVDGAVLHANASVCPSKGPDMGGQSVVVRIVGLVGHAVSHVTVCGVPATIEKQKGNKLVIMTGARGSVKRRSDEDEQPADGDIQICTLAGPTFVLQRCYSYLPSIDFFAIVRIEQGLPAQKYGFVMTDFGAGTKTQDGYGVSLAFDKAGMSTLKHWHKRWFEVNLGVLTSSRSVSDPSEQVLPISDELNIELEPQTRVGRAHVLRISTYNKSVLVQAHSEDDQLEWAAVMRQAAFLVTGVKVPEMRATNISIQAFKTVESARSNGHPNLHNMTPLEMLAQEYGIVRKQGNGKKPSHRVNDNGYDDIFTESPRHAQDPSSVDPLNPSAMGNTSRLKVAPRRSVTAPGEASGETRRFGYGYALDTLSPGGSSVDMFMSEHGHEPVARTDRWHIPYDGNHAPMLDPELLQFLQGLDIDMTTPMSIVHIFKREQIDIRALRLLGEDELRELGVPLGPRKKILDGLKHTRRRRAESSATSPLRERTSTTERACMPPLPEPPGLLQSRSGSDSTLMTPDKHSVGSESLHTSSVQKRV